MICGAIRGNDTAQIRQMIKAVDEWQISLIAPKNFNVFDPSNYLRKFDASFENVVTSLEELGIENPGELDLYRFYSKIQYFKKKKKANKKQQS